MRIAFLFLIVSYSVAIPTQVWAFNLMGHQWNITTSSPNVCWYVDQTNNPGIPAGTVTGGISDAVQMWQDVETSFITFSQCGSAPSVSSPGILIQFSETGAAGGLGGCGGMSGGYCVLGTITVSSGLSTSITRAVFAGLIAHEVGHALGLAHSDRKSIMSYHKSTDVLSQDDWAAITYLYPTDAAKEDYHFIPGCGSVRLPPSSGPTLVWMSGAFLILAFYGLIRISWRVHPSRP